MNTSGVTVSGYNATTLGEQTITVKYKNKTATFNVTVKNDVTGISIKSVPSKVSYIKGENLDLTGGVISVTYEDGSTNDVPIIANEVGISGYDLNNIGEQKVMVNYNGNVASFNIIVSNKGDEILVNPKTGGNLLVICILSITFIVIAIVIRKKYY